MIRICMAVACNYYEFEMLAARSYGMHDAVSFDTAAGTRWYPVPARAPWPRFGWRHTAGPVARRPRSSRRNRLVVMSGALRWTPLSITANGEPFGAVFERPAIAEIIASPALRDELSVRTHLCQLAMYYIEYYVW